MKSLCPIDSEDEKALIKAAYETEKEWKEKWEELQAESETGEHREDVRYKIEDGLMYYRNNWTLPWRLCVSAESTKKKLIYDHHSTPIAGHPGADRTFGKLARSFYWPKMFKDVQQFVKTCPECQLAKPANRATQGLLQPMSIPARPWQEISMDFCGPFETSPETGNDMVLVVVDRLTKMVMILPCKKTITAEETAYLFVNNVFRLHGLPDAITSDRDPRFVAKIWKEIHNILGTKLRMSTTAHPQTDGQSERTIRTMEQTLGALSLKDRSSWESKLAMVEFAYNDSIHSSISTTPFEANYGFSPTGITRHAMSEDPAAENFIASLSDTIARSRDAMQGAQDRQKQQADKHRREPEEELAVGKYALVRRRKVPKEKLGRLWDGPFKILKRHGNTAQLQLPPDSKAFSTYNVSRLKPYHGELPDTAWDPDTTEDPVYDVEELYGHACHGGKWSYAVRWVGYTEEDDSWEPGDHIDPDTVRRYWEKIRVAGGTVPEGAVPERGGRV